MMNDEIKETLDGALSMIALKIELNDASFKDEEAIIFNPEWDGFLYVHFIRMKYFFNTNKNNESKNEFEIINRLIKEDGKWNLYKNDTVFLKELYKTVAKNFSALKDYNQELKYFKLYQYYSSQINSKNIKEDSVILYSFRRINQFSLYDLSSNSITVCNPKLMNDPFDSLYCHWSEENNLYKTCTIKIHIKSLSKSFNYYRIRSFVGNNKLTESSKILNNKTMWAHYGENHMGFCILYRFSNNIIKRDINDENIHWYLQRIKYIKGKLSILKTESNTTELFATKHSQWKRENEVRLISYNPNREEDFDYIPLDENSSIKAIYFGYRCTDENITLIKSILGNNVKYYKMEANPDDIYNMKIKNISKL